MYLTNILSGICKESLNFSIGKQNNKTICTNTLLSKYTNCKYPHQEEMNSGVYTHTPVRTAEAWKSDVVYTGMDLEELGPQSPGGSQLSSSLHM